jgi:nucleoside-diphosphate-sugar epimerase
MLTHGLSEPRKPGRVVVLGAGGFLGRHLCAALTAGGIPALALGSNDIDLADAAAGARLRERLTPADSVVFLSALTPDKGRDSATLMRNLAMARSVCEATRGANAAHLIYASSDAVYSFADETISEATPAVPADLYGAMHRTRELILGAEAQVPLAILRLTAIYGAGDTHNSYGPNRFIRQALADGRIPLFGGGEETRDHLYVDDAVALIVQALASRSTGLANLASGESVSFGDVARQVAALAGRPVEIQPSARQNPATHRRFDIANLKRAFPNVALTPLADGLRKTVATAKAPSRG